MATPLAKLRAQIKAAPISRSSDGAFGVTVVVRTTDTADRLARLAREAGCEVMERTRFKRAWCPYLGHQSQAIRLVISGKSVREDCYLAGVITMAQLLAI